MVMVEHAKGAGGGKDKRLQGCESNQTHQDSCLVYPSVNFACLHVAGSHLFLAARAFCCDSVLCRRCMWACLLLWAWWILVGALAHAQTPSNRDRNPSSHLGGSIWVQGV